MSSLNRALLWLACMALAFSFLFVRIYSSRDVFMVPPAGDDLGYYVFTEAILKTHTFNWLDPKFTYNYGSEFNRYSPGPAFLLLPFTSFGLLLEKVGIYQSPGLDNLRFWSVIGTFFLFFGGVIALFFLARRILKDDFPALLSTFFFLCGNILLYYVYRRPLMSHASEFFLIFSGFLLCQKQKERELTPLLVFLMGFVTALITVVRHNDFPVSVFISFWFLYFTYRQSRSCFLKLAFTFLCGAALPLIYFFTIYYLETGSVFYKVKAYDEKLGFWMIYRLNWGVMRRFFDFFASRHWGMFLLMPVMFFEVVLILGHFQKLKSLWNRYYPLFICGFGMAFLHLLVVANYSNNGMSYGYRYTLPVIYGLHILFLLSISKGSKNIFRKRLVLIGLCLGAVVASFNVLNFESNATTLTLTEGRLSDEGIYDVTRRDVVELRGPNFAVNSLKNTLSGKALQNLVATPLAAYALFSVQPFVTNGGRLWQQALSYYNSPKRSIYSLSDLKVLFNYQLIVLIFLLIGIFFARVYLK